MTTPAGPYDHRGAYGPEAAPVLPMPDAVTYRCAECGAEISHRDPFEAHSLYVDHIDIHDPEHDPAELARQAGVTVHDEDPRDPDPLTDAEVAELEDRGARYADDLTTFPLADVDPEATD